MTTCSINSHPRRLGYRFHNLHYERKYILITTLDALFKSISLVFVFPLKGFAWCFGCCYKWGLALPANHGSWPVWVELFWADKEDVIFLFVNCNTKGFCRLGTRPSCHLRNGSVQNIYEYVPDALIRFSAFKNYQPKVKTRENLFFSVAHRNSPFIISCWVSVQVMDWYAASNQVPSSPSFDTNE